MDEITIKGINYGIILNVAETLTNYDKSMWDTYKLVKESLPDDVREKILVEIKQRRCFTQVLIDWLKENKES